MTMTALLIKRADETRGAAVSLHEEAAGGYLSLPFLGEQLEAALPRLLVCDDLVEQVTAVCDVLPSNKSLHGAFEGLASPRFSSPTDRAGQCG